nr:hypothetical protein [Tanacetum cinerariifolium]
MILGELHRLNDLELNYLACGCQLRKSCGLPCACELLAYLNSGEAILLYSVDIFCRTLDVSWSTPLEHEDIQCDDELHIFKETFNKQSNAGKKSLLRRLGDIINPGTNLIREPTVKKNTRGRPSLKKQKKKKVVYPKSQDPGIRSYSTRLFGIDLNMELARHSSYSNYETRAPNLFPDLNEEPARHNYYVSRSFAKHGSSTVTSDSERFLRHLPQIFHPYLTRLQDVRGDGNCGFGSVDVALGLSEDQQTIKVQRDWDYFLSAWKLLEDSPTWISYVENYKQLQLVLRKYPRVLSYVYDNWLNNHKEKFVSACLLRGFISNKALDMILGELHRLNDLELSYSACGCQLRKSCGLPCSCELLAYLNSGEAIPLDSVDIFWRALDVSWSTPLEHEDIQCLQDVRGDGNCGFRSVDVALGLSEDQWPQIRLNLVWELEANHQNYKYIFGTAGYKQIYKTVRFAGKWMKMPNTGLIIASAYNIVVISLANGGNRNYVKVALYRLLIHYGGLIEVTLHLDGKTP